MNKQPPEAMMAAVDKMAAKQMGVEPQMPPQGGPQGGPPPPPSQPPMPPQPPKANPNKGPDSKEGQAAEAGSPTTEGDKMVDDAVIYDVDFGEGVSRKLTPQQIKSTFERYSAMNYKNAQYKPVLDVLEAYMKENPNLSTKEIAENVAAMQKAGQSNPVMGNVSGEKSGDAQRRNGVDSGDMNKAFSKWEEDNAAQLPPGYREMMESNGSGMAAMQQQLQQTQQMLQQVLGNSAGVADAAKMSMDGARNQQVDAMRQSIGNNIDRVQQALGLPDDKANDFMVFAAERGFTMEDFADPQLTIKVMQDFKNNMDSPEMERMRAIAQRRQAYTGSMGSTPSASPAGAEAASGNDTFDKLASMAMSKKGLG